MARSEALEICVETAQDLSEQIKRTIQERGALPPTVAILLRSSAQRDAAYHAIFGFSFYKDREGRRSASRPWLGNKLREG